MLGDTSYVRNLRPHVVVFLPVLYISQYVTFSSDCQILDTNDDICHDFLSYRSAKPSHVTVECPTIFTFFRSSCRRTSKLKEYRILKESSQLTRSRALIPIWRFTCYILFLFSFCLRSPGALNFLYISFSFAKFQLADIQPAATCSVVIVRHLSVTFYYCLVSVRTVATRPATHGLSSSSFCTSFRLLPRAQRLLTKLLLYRRSCRAIHVKPFKLKFIYATAFVMREHSSAAFFVSL